MTTSPDPGEEREAGELWGRAVGRCCSELARRRLRLHPTLGGQRGRLLPHRGRLQVSRRELAPSTYGFILF